MTLPLTRGSVLFCRPGHPRSGGPHVTQQFCKPHGGCAWPRRKLRDECGERSVVQRLWREVAPDGRNEGLGKRAAGHAGGGEAFAAKVGACGAKRVAPPDSRGQCSAAKSS